MKHSYYANGEIKPYFRGFLHLISLCLFPLTIIPLFWYCDNYDKFLSISFYKFSILLTLLFSTLFHNYKWKLSTELILQKFDHASIILVCFYSWYPISFIYLKNYYFINISFYLSIIFYFYIVFISNSYKIIFYIISASFILLYLPIIFPLLTSFEIFNLFFIYIFYILGLLTYQYKFFDFYPFIFGYHEVFHVFVIISFILTYITNISIITRN
jgi:hemolysin III